MSRLDKFNSVNYDSMMQKCNDINDKLNSIKYDNKNLNNFNQKITIENNELINKYNLLNNKYEKTLLNVSILKNKLTIINNKNIFKNRIRKFDKLFAKTVMNNYIMKLINMNSLKLSNDLEKMKSRNKKLKTKVNKYKDNDKQLKFMLNTLKIKI